MTGDGETAGTVEHRSPPGARLLRHLRDHHGIDATAVTQLSVHQPHVFRVDRRDGDAWVARAFSAARPRHRVEGDAAILRFLEHHRFPAERLAADAPVSELDGGAVVVTRFVDGGPTPDGAQKFTVMGDLLGRLHALPLEQSVARPGGASGEDPRHEGVPGQDLLAARSMLDAVAADVPAGERERFDRLRQEVDDADDADGLPESLVHGNLLHAPDHVVASSAGPVVINWRSSGRGPRLADLAYLIWGTGRWSPRRPEQTHLDAAVEAYRRHVEPTDDELDRLEAVMYLRALYLVCFGFRRAVTAGVTFDEWDFARPPEYFAATAAAARAAFRRESNPGPPINRQDFSVRSLLCLCSDPPVAQTSRCDGPSHCEMSPPDPVTGSGGEFPS